MNANEPALYKYIAACREISDRLADLQEMAAEHFDKNPERIGWTDVSTVNHMNSLLAEISKLASSYSNRSRT